MVTKKITGRGAVLSRCQKYRYSLYRSWTDDITTTLNNFVTFILLNPSKADAVQDDPTLTRGIGFAQQWGYDGVVFVNLFAWRTKDPSVLKKVGDPIGPANDFYLRRETSRSRMNVAAWGANAAFSARADFVKRILSGYQLYCLGQTKGGFPKHILYLAKDTPLERYEYERPA